MSRNEGPFILLILVALLSLSCGQKMADQPKYRPLDPSDFFLDGASARPPVANTVARGYLRDDSELFTGKTAQGAEVTTFPFAIARSDLERGRERFEIYCAPCHGLTGAGDGIVVQRGFSPPPTFHSDRLRGASIGHFFDVITNGYGAMPDYRTQIPARDRWDIIAYIRALQLSENAPVTVVPTSIRERLATSETPIVENTPTPGPTQ